MARSYKELGVSSDFSPSWGLRQDDFIVQLRGTQGVKKYREMRENDPIIGAILHAMDMMLRSVEWRIEGGSETSRAFVRSVMDGMENSTWEEFISDVLTFLPYGFSVFEIVPRRDPDGAIRIRKLAPRAQWTIQRFITDDNDKILGVEQSAARRNVVIPYGRILHFKTTSINGEPSGRALAPDTPIPTPDGWATMGDMRIGSKVFDENGKIRYVTGVAGWNNRPTYEIEFSSGERIIADENHQWVVRDGKNIGNDGEYKKLTTRQIFRYGVILPGKENTSRWSIETCGALDYPEQALPVDPYYFGYWLGDGNSRNTSITTHVDDVEDLCEHLHSAGYTTKVVLNGKEGGAGRLVRVQGSKEWASDGPSFGLRMLGVYHNKHVPDAYMRGSYEQRLSLLQGLMDSDGTISEDGKAEFGNTNRALSEAVVELVRSLGGHARITTKRSRKFGGGGYTGSINYRVHFTPHFAAFRLPRKADRVRTEKSRFSRNYIRSVKPHTRMNTICIEVDSPSHLFLCGRSMVPTHNSVLRSAYTSWKAANNIKYFEGVGIERELNGLPIVRVPSEYLASDATDAQAAFIAAIKTAARDVKRNEQGYLILPSDPYTDDDGKISSMRQVEFDLIASKGTRDIDTSAVILRYQQDMARSVMADFVMLGANDRGSFALSKSKADLFLKALEGYMETIAGVLNRRFLPHLWSLNGFDAADMPKLARGRVAPIDLQELGQYIQRLSLSGVQMFPDEKLDAYLRTVAGLPEPDPNARPSAQDPLAPGNIQQQESGA